MLNLGRRGWVRDLSNASAGKDGAGEGDLSKRCLIRQSALSAFLAGRLSHSGAWLLPSIKIKGGGGTKAGLGDALSPGL